MNIRVNNVEAEETLKALTSTGDIEVLEEHHIPTEIQEESLRRLHLMKTEPGYSLTEEAFFDGLNEDGDEKL